MNPIMANGVPDGKNLRKKDHPCNRNPMTNFPIQMANPKVIVTIKWDVTVKEYGTNPNLLHPKMKVKIEKMIGNNGAP